MEKMPVKIRFDLSSEKGPAGETLWAEDMGNNLYKLMNVPFEAKGYAEGDIVRCEYRDGWNEVVALEEDSGNGTIRIGFPTPYTDPKPQKVINELLSVGCTYEAASQTFFAFTVPPTLEVHWLQIASYLNGLDDSFIKWWEVGKFLPRDYNPEWGTLT